MDFATMTAFSVMLVLWAMLKTLQLLQLRLLLKQLQLQLATQNKGNCC
jgi:hypothetical protein